MEHYVDLLQSAFIDMWTAILLFLPQFLLALIIILLGFLLAGILKAAIERVSALVKLDQLMDVLEVKAAFKKANIDLHIGGFLGWLAKWFILILALIIAADTLGWDQITVFLSEVVSYIPNVIIAVVILLVGIVLGSFVQGIIKSTLDASGLQTSAFLSGIAKWSIVVFSFMAALVQLGIAESLIQVLFTGFVAMVALAGGLAFGLGGKEFAAEILKKIKKDLVKGEGAGSGKES